MLLITVKHICQKKKQKTVIISITPTPLFFRKREVLLKIHRHMKTFFSLLTLAIAGTAVAVLAEMHQPLRQVVPHHAHHDNNDGATAADTCHKIIQDEYPRQYVSYFTSTPPVLDGNIDDDPVWKDVPWTDSFTDLNTNMTPPKLTRAKIRHDNEWLYIAYDLHDDAAWANITHTCHCINASEDQVIFHDNDAEVFLDPSQTTHYYKEYEMNAANQNWNLCLDKPYQDGGYENSSRVYGKHGFDYTFGKNPLRSAVRVVSGALNDPASFPHGWQAEIAFPLEKVVYNTTATLPPQPGVRGMWRFDLSRVEWGVKIHGGKYWKEPSCKTCVPVGSKTCDNWVFQHIVYSDWPSTVPDIHVPELWAFLQFSLDAPAKNPASQKIYNDEFPARYAAHVLYYAQRNYFTKYQRYTDSLPRLLQFAQYPEVLAGGCVKTPVIELMDGGNKYVATIGSHDIPGMNITVTYDRFTQAHYP